MKYSVENHFSLLPIPVPCSKYKTGSQLLLLIPMAYLGSQRNLVFLAFFSPDKPFSKRQVYKHRVMSLRLIRNIERFSILCWKSSHSSVPSILPALMAWKMCHQSVGGERHCHVQERHHPVKGRLGWELHGHWSK